MQNSLIIRSKQVGAFLLFVNIIVAIIYFGWWLIPGHVGNPVLYALLFFGEVFHVFMSVLFWLTIWPKKTTENILQKKLFSRSPWVDIYIPVAGEYLDIIEKTIIGAKKQQYSNFKVYVLNDGYVTQKENWKDVEVLCQKLRVNCITRKFPGGAKAGNINNALKKTDGEIIVLLDADMVAHEDFLSKLIPYFEDEKVGFVQTPQFYKNSQNNEITKGAWEQQEFFFGPIMEGKNTVNSAFICGTNVAIRRDALEEVGGMYEQSVAEDFLTSLFIHQKGWKSIYHKEVLVEGLAPEDLSSFYKQQLRWARGSLEVLFNQNPIFKKGLSLMQKLQYLSSALYHFNGFVVMIDIFTPLIFLFFAIEPVSASTTAFAIFFIPFMFLNLYSINLASSGSLTFRAISFTQSSWVLQLLAIKGVLLNEKSIFFITPKKAQTGNFLSLVYPHLIYILLSVIASFVAIAREGINPSVATNISWVIFNIVLFLPFISTAFNWNFSLSKFLKQSFVFREKFMN